MKKMTLLFMMCVLASMAMSAQENNNDNSYFDYLPFVKGGKSWHVVRSTSGQDKMEEIDYYIQQGVEEVNIDGNPGGRTFYKLDRFFIREENRKVYLYDPTSEVEFLMFDYSLKAGDTYETYSYDEQKVVSYNVLSVNDYWEGPEVTSYDYDVIGDSTIMQHRYLRKWTVCRTDDRSQQKTWIEGVGSLEGPLANLYDSRPVSSKDYLAYVVYAVDDYLIDQYLTFSFFDTLNRKVHGCNLPKDKVGNSNHEDREQLSYELEGDRLHVFGKVNLNCGSCNYVYFIEEPTDDPLEHKIRFIIQDVGPVATCTSLFATNFYVPGFDPNINYIVVDNQDEEHPVINKTPQNEYRSFVDEGKVWKVGDYNSGNPVKLVEYFYFDGDTIIDGKTCKQMVCQRYVNPSHPDYAAITQSPSKSKVGAWYEENKQVYQYDSTNKRFELMYDFSLQPHDTLQINDQQYIIGPRETGGLEGFKGVYRDVVNHMAYKTTWLEGVGGLFGPTINIYSGKLNPAWFLMSCTIGDEVIYLNDEYEDGATPEAMKAPKRRFDFTHTTKTRPKAPMRRGAEQSLYGEYNDLQLGVNLDPLDDAYLVRIMNESGRTVYEKAVNAGNIVALNIDISAYAKGRYTVIVENSSETFIGEIETQTTGIEEVRYKRPEVRGGIYNLQGQRLGSLQKGLNIVNGKKIIVK